jgi:hypothetical protein
MQWWAGNGDSALSMRMLSESTWITTFTRFALSGAKSPLR